MVTTLYATMAVKTSNNGKIATLEPFKNVRTLIWCDSELMISFNARNKIKDPTAMIL